MTRWRQVQRKTYEKLNEVVYRTTATSGLTIYYVPKKEFHQTYAIFMTNYGAVDTTFTPLGQTKRMTVPDGIAHFLEHTLFEKGKRNIFTEFMQRGASPNAYTSYTKTAYFFTATERSVEHVLRLLDFVQDGYVSEQTVEKEKGIINQEIAMYEDDPDWQTFMQTVRGMYNNHPIRKNIAGSKESIAQISLDDLAICHETFYHPKNMVLFITGNIHPEALHEQIEENQAKKMFKAFKPIERFFPVEEQTVATDIQTLYLSVSQPKVAVGMKDIPIENDVNERIKRELLQAMLLDYFFSETGDYYEQLYDSRLIDHSFTYSTTVEDTFSFSLMMSNTNEPEQLTERFMQLLTQLKDARLTDEDVRLMKRKQLGVKLRQLNFLESIANNFVHYHFSNFDYFDIFSLIETIRLDDFHSFVKQWIQPERISVCKILSD